MSSFGNTEQARTPDGKYAPMSTPGTDTSVLDPDDPRAARARALASDGYVEATTFKTSIDPSTTAHRRRWWGQNFAAAEFGHESGDRPVMPDDYTPNNTPGRALSHNRRTHRMNYQSAPGVSIRMPSKTSIRRFSAENKNVTFDVPVSANVDGKLITGHVRVTKGSDGRWDAYGVGFADKSDEVRIAESVSMTLENQRPAMSVSAAAMVVAHRRERQGRGESIVTHPVKSSWVKSVGIQASDSNESLMIMRTQDAARKDGSIRPGRTYGYQIDQATYQEFRDSPAPGVVFNARIKGQTQRVAVERCGDCKMFTATPHGGNCPSNRVTGRQQGQSNRSAMREAAAALTRRSRQG